MADGLSTTSLTDMSRSYNPVPEPISPLDPTRPGSEGSTENTHDFFKAVYLDHSPFAISHFDPDVEVRGITKPLRIRKKKSARAVRAVSGMSLL